MATNAAPDPQDAVPPAATPDLLTLAASGNRARKLSEDLGLILHEFEVETVTLREAMAVLKGRGYVLLVMLLALPFSTPIPLPGLSTPFGFIIALIGVRLALGKKPWLPAKLLDTRLPPKLFAKVFAAARTILRGFEYFLRPRLLWLTRPGPLAQVHAIPIVLCAVLLLLPLPIPFSNLLPAFAILLLAAGLLENDGLFILVGYVAAVLAHAYFVLVGVVGVEGIEAMWRWLRN
ncbi:MAG TPA: exopolysaccharide biosynthesis protein [Opitutus sp.]|nr:exopolysaccharide biosynthesis protein [Opitutus sp.]